MTRRIRVGDLVEVISGADRGKQGRVLGIDAGGDRVRVEKVRVQKRHLKPGRKLARTGGILEREGHIHVSNVMIVSPDNDKRTRIGSKLLPDGSRARIGRRSGEVLDQ
jgi:large subunit ribosomal protein L24